MGQYSQRCQVNGCADDAERTWAVRGYNTQCCEVRGPTLANSAFVVAAEGLSEQASLPPGSTDWLNSELFNSI
eukprot:3116382-Pyramimonas_sp.AAC.1